MIAFVTRIAVVALLSLGSQVGLAVAMSPSDMHFLQGQLDAPN